eukprot:scaffold37929_cov52-Phaeocystis_antarctica.AAC.2
MEGQQSGYAGATVNVKPENARPLDNARPSTAPFGGPAAPAALTWYRMARELADISMIEKSKRPRCFAPPVKTPQ